MNDNYDAKAQEAYNNTVPNEEIEDTFELYMCGDKFYIYAYDTELQSLTWWGGLSAQTARIHMEKAGKKVSTMYRDLTTVHEVRYRNDLFSPSRLELTLDIEESKKILTKYNNISERWRNTGNYDMEIIKEYRTKVFEDKLDDLIELIILTLKYKESKLISLLLTGLSNKGKTEVMKIMKMFTVKADRFEGILGGNKIGVDEFNGMLESGMIVIDEVNRLKSLESMKGLEPELKVQMNYSGGIAIPISFYTLTSASNPFDGADDEIANRIMHIALEGDFILNDSEEFQRDDKRYKENCTMYIRHKMLEVLNGDTSRDRLKELQVRYRMNTDEVDSIINEVKEEVRADIRGATIIANPNIDVMDLNGSFRIKNKGQVKTLIRESLKRKAKGITIQFDKTVNTILDALISKNRIGGKYYDIKMFD